MAAKFINFHEATMVHGNALFTAAIVSRSTRHGPGPQFTLSERQHLCPKTSSDKSDNSRWKSDLQFL